MSIGFLHIYCNTWLYSETSINRAFIIQIFDFTNQSLLSYDFITALDASDFTHIESAIYSV